jgi:hypothetical protein
MPPAEGTVKINVDGACTPPSRHRQCPGSVQYNAGEKSNSTAKATDEQQVSGDSVFFQFAVDRKAQGI